MTQNLMAGFKSNGLEVDATAYVGTKPNYSLIQFDWSTMLRP